MAHITFLTGPGATIPMEDDAHLADLVFNLRRSYARHEPLTFTIDPADNPESGHFYIPADTPFVAGFDGGYPDELDQRIGEMLDSTRE